MKFFFADEARKMGFMEMLWDTCGIPNNMNGRIGNYQEMGPQKESIAMLGGSSGDRMGFVSSSNNMIVGCV